MRKFDTKVQYLKYKVLREVARSAWNDSLLQDALEIPKIIVPGKTSTMRCCVYKERAIINERIKIVLSKTQNNKIINVIDIACDECPEAGYVVTNLCRGCLAHSCQVACPRDAIYIDEQQHAHIDKSKCIECGKCHGKCKMDIREVGDHECINCGECIGVCPTKAISWKGGKITLKRIVRTLSKSIPFLCFLIMPILCLLHIPFHC